MTRHTLTITEDAFEELSRAIFSEPNLEGAAYVLCGRSVTDSEVRLLVREVIAVRPEHYLVREPLRLSIDSASFVSAAKRASDRKDSILFVHSHPAGFPQFSTQDNLEEPKLAGYFERRVPSGLPHGSLIVSGRSAMHGRVWTPQGILPIERVRILGGRFRFIDHLDAANDDIPEFFARQVRAFGPDIQKLLGRLHVGVVGAGGTGSAVIEQLTRLGVGTLSIFDGDTLEGSNTNRVYGSSVSDTGENKAEIAAEHVRRIGLGTRVCVFPRHITEVDVARELRACDLVVGCTDRDTPRGILVRLSLDYLIPIFDLGVKIDSSAGVMRSITGRVTTLLPGEACMFCRGRTTAERIRLESMTPEERQALVEERYAPELETEAPAVITFTTMVAAQAVNELLHRLTGFMGEDRRSTEVLMHAHDGRIRTNRVEPSPGCFCIDRTRWGKGDSRRFLDLSWTRQVHPSNHHVVEALP